MKVQFRVLSDLISHSHKTVFVHVPKCGGQSIETAFLADLGLDWETRAPLLLRLNDNSRLGPPRLAHLIARDYARYHYLSDELFRSYYSFAILRDPVARTVSLYNFLLSMGTLPRAMGFDTFLFDWLAKQLQYGQATAEEQNSPTHGFFFVRPQVDFIVDMNGAVCVKDVFFLESLGRAYPVIQQKSGLRTSLGHANKSVQHFQSAQLDPRHIDFIRELYAADFDFIGSHTTS